MSAFFYNQICATVLLILTFLLAIIWALPSVRKRTRRITPLRILFVGTFFASLAHYMPIFAKRLATEDGFIPWIDVLLNSIQYSVKIFTFGGDIMWIAEKSNELFANPNFALFIASVFYIVAPLFTVGFILSFFNNLTSRIKYFLHFYAHAHVFTELNEKSLAMANDIAKSRTFKYKLFPSDIIVFTDVSDKNRDDVNEMLERAYDISAIIFRKSVGSVKLRYQSTTRKVNVYIISDDESKKIRQAEAIMQSYDYEGLEIYLFSDSIQTDLLMASKNVRHIKVVRINDTRSLIYSNLYNNGKLLFERAREIDGEKVISAIIVGLGKHGQEMLKALSWFCQVEGYTLKINAFGTNENAESQMKALCPELLSDEYNNKRIFGEPFYDIRIHSGTDVFSSEFAEKICSINDATYVCVCLDDDNTNLKIASSLRRLSEQVVYLGNGRKPDIEAVIRSSFTRSRTGINWADIDSDTPVGVTNHNSQPFNILMTGDLDNLYTVSILINSELIRAGKDNHLEYARSLNDPKKLVEAEDTFWRYEYNYNSSLAKALHQKFKAELGIVKTFTKDEWENQTREDKVKHANGEHNRWSAYMRSEGYSLSTKYGQEETNHLGKLHKCLVSTEALPDNELIKDVVIIENNK